MYRFVFSYDFESCIDYSLIDYRELSNDDESSDEFSQYLTDSYIERIRDEHNKVCNELANKVDKLYKELKTERNNILVI